MLAAWAFSTSSLSSAVDRSCGYAAREEIEAEHLCTSSVEILDTTAGRRRTTWRGIPSGQRHCCSWLQSMSSALRALPVRVDQVAAAAGINKERIYQYFGRKEALFGAVLSA